MEYYVSGRRYGGHFVLSALNSSCIEEDGQFALRQQYLVTAYLTDYLLSERKERQFLTHEVPFMPHDLSFLLFGVSVRAYDPTSLDAVLSRMMTSQRSALPIFDFETLVDMLTLPQEEPN